MARCLQYHYYYYISNRLKMISQFRALQWMLLFVAIYLVLINSAAWYRSLTAVEKEKPSVLYAAEQRNVPVVFIGGCPRSGTTLMRVLLDSHPQVSCGPETHILPKLLAMYGTMRNVYEQTRMEMAGIDKDLQNRVLRNFIFDIIVGHIKKGGSPLGAGGSSYDDAALPFVMPCNKDPFLLNNAVYLKRLFPKAKFIFMVRDGRAVAHSIVTRQISITKLNLSSYTDVIKKWDSITESMSMQCTKLGRSCLKVYYEKLILNPKPWLEKVLHFLDIPWSDNVLKHDQLIADGAIQLSTLERSTDQVIKPINLDSLDSWVGKIPPDVVANMSSLAPMLKVLGYDPHANPPNYGKVNEFVLANMRSIEARHEDWSRQAEEINNKRLKLRQKLRKLTKEFDFKGDERQLEEVNQYLLQKDGEGENKKTSA